MALKTITHKKFFHFKPSKENNACRKNHIRTFSNKSLIKSKRSLIMMSHIALTMLFLPVVLLAELDKWLDNMNAIGKKGVLDL